VNVEGDEEQELPEDVALCLYRVLQEALFNIHKHAAAKQVEVYLRLTPEEVRLSVEDDGRGFLVRRRLSRAADTGHIGLLGLRERLKVVHGTLRINSFPGLGTRLEARVPLAASVGRKQGAGER
jgi:signal transduction histidine kinase